MGPLGSRRRAPPPRLDRCRSVRPAPAERYRAAAIEPEIDPTTAWLAALRAVLHTESSDDARIGTTVMCRVVLHVLDTDPQPRVIHHLERQVEHVLDGGDTEDAWAAYRAFGRGTMPVAAALVLVGEFGAVDAAGRALTTLGRWALRPRPAAPHQQTVPLQRP